MSDNLSDLALYLVTNEVPVDQCQLIIDTVSANKNFANLFKYINEFETWRTTVEPSEFYRISFLWFLTHVKSDKEMSTEMYDKLMSLPPDARNCLREFYTSKKRALSEPSSPHEKYGKVG